MNYLNFTLNRFTESGKTKIVDVTSKEGYSLGQIKWYGPWRKYCFFPSIDTIFDMNCLNEIIFFMKDGIHKI